MTSKRVKLLKRILASLNGITQLNNNKGPCIGISRHIDRKDRKHRGWVTPAWPKHPGMKYQDAIKEALEQQDYYDEWKSYKDGFRKYYQDASHFKKGIPEKYFDNPYIKEWAKGKHVNKKLIKELRIRQAAKLKRKSVIPEVWDKSIQLVY